MHRFLLMTPTFQGLRAQGGVFGFFQGISNSVWSLGYFFFPFSMLSSWNKRWPHPSQPPHTAYIACNKKHSPGWWEDSPTVKYRPGTCTALIHSPTQTKKGRGGRAEGRCGGSVGCFLVVDEQFNQTSKGAYISYSIFLRKLNTERYGGGAGPQRCKEIHVILRTETDHQETSWGLSASVFPSCSAIAHSFCRLMAQIKGGHPPASEQGDSPPKGDKTGGTLLENNKTIKEKLIFI